MLDGENLRLTSTNAHHLQVAIYPPPESIAQNGDLLPSKRDGLFQLFAHSHPAALGGLAAATSGVTFGNQSKFKENW